MYPGILLSIFFLSGDDVDPSPVKTNSIDVLKLYPFPALFSLKWATLRAQQQAS